MNFYHSNFLLNVAHNYIKEKDQNIYPKYNLILLIFQMIFLFVPFHVIFY